MSVLPDWNSIESTARWSDILFWVGIGSLVLLAATEVASHVYGSRSSYLASEAAQLRQELADAHRTAIDARKTAAAVARQAAPRHLAAPQKVALVTAIVPFRGRAVYVVAPMGDGEAKAFAAEFVSVFREAGWDAGPNDGISQAVFGGPPVYGIQVTLNDSEAKTGRLPAGAEPLVRALISMGLAKGVFANSQIQAGALELRVGSKGP